MAAALVASILIMNPLPRLWDAGAEAGFPPPEGGAPPPEEGFPPPECVVDGWLGWEGCEGRLWLEVWP